MTTSDTSSERERLFQEVHQRTIRQAAADKAIANAEEAADPSARARRYHAWLENMQRAFGVDL